MAYRKAEPAVSPHLRTALIVVAAVALLFILLRGCGGSAEEETAPVNTTPPDIRNLPDATPQPGTPGYGDVSGG